MFFDKIWFNRGIQLIEHIYDFRKKDFYNFTELSNLYNLPQKYFLFYNSLVSSISQEWKSKLKLESTYTQTHKSLLQKSIKKKHINKYLYEQLLLNDEHMEIKHQNKWSIEFEKEDLKWKDIYLIPIRATIDTKLREFQYKFITRIIPTNTFLYKCNISNSSLCEFCCRDVETVKHLFWDCHYAQHFWSQLTTFLAESNMTVDFNYKLVCFGKANHQNKEILINFIIISAKYYIFKNKCIKTIPNIVGYKHFLNKRIEIEKCLAFDKDKLEQHRQKWSPLI